MRFVLLPSWEGNLYPVPSQLHGIIEAFNYHAALDILIDLASLPYANHRYKEPFISALVDDPVFPLVESLEDLSTRIS